MNYRLLILLLICIICTYTDLRRRKIYNIVILLGFISGIIELACENNYLVYFITALLIFAVSILFPSNSIGGGDVKLLSLCGFLLSPIALMIFATATFLPLIPTMVYAKNKKLPLAPFTLVGCIVTLLISMTGVI